MSSGYISEDKKLISFEINHSRIQGRFTIAQIDGNEANIDRVLLKFHTQSANYPDSMECTNSVIITKDYSKVLASIFRKIADTMDDWFVV